MTMLRWFISQNVRHACAVHKHYRRLLAAQRDILPATAIAEVQVKLDELTAAIREGHKGRTNIKAEELQFAAEKNIKPYPAAAWRENVEVLLVALAVAMAIRTFFLQPFKIPTGSMQPTLFGVTSTPNFSMAVGMADRFEELANNNYQVPDEAKDALHKEVLAQIEQQKTVIIPDIWQRIKDGFHGVTYVHFVAPVDGQVEAETPPWPGAMFSLYQKFKFAGEWHTVWFPPDYGDTDLRHHAGLIHGRTYKQGDDVIRLKANAGDHLFVDRMTYNFRKPERGETIVFATVGTQITLQDQFYIKRLTVLPGEKVSIGNDRHMRINGQRLDASTPHFGNVYGFNPDKPPRESQFSGHLNGTVAQQYGIAPVAPQFEDEEKVYQNGPDAYMVFGDNTCNSSDSRTWGSLPTKNVIGKNFFVYWPLTARFGCGPAAN